MLSASAVAIVVSNVTYASASTIIAASSAITISAAAAALTFDFQARRRQQRTAAADAMVKSCLGERLKKVYFNAYFT